MFLSRDLDDTNRLEDTLSRPGHHRKVSSNVKLIPALAMGSLSSSSGTAMGGYASGGLSHAASTSNINVYTHETIYGLNAGGAGVLEEALYREEEASSIAIRPVRPYDVIAQRIAMTTQHAVFETENTEMNFPVGDTSTSN